MFCTGAQDRSTSSSEHFAIDGVHDNPEEVAIEILQQKVAVLLPDWNVSTISAFTYLPGGYSNRNYTFHYDQKRYVLRLPHAPQPFVDRQHEYHWYQQLPQNVGIKPIALDVKTGQMISPWVEGELLAEVWPSFNLADLVRYLKTFHQALPATDRHYDLPSLTTAYLGEMAKHYSSYPTDPIHRITCHNDLNPWNILITDSGWVTLDWEFVGNNDPLFDLVALHQGLALPPDGLAEFAERYIGFWSKHLQARLQQAQYGFWLREMGWAHYQIETGNRRAEILQQKTMAQSRLKDLARLGP